MKEKNIKMFSATELKERLARGESRSDLARIRSMTDEDVERQIAGDPDWKDVPEDWYCDAETVLPPGKKLISLRLDGDVIDWFRDGGAGYQTRINHVLRTFMEHSMKSEKVRRRGGAR
jgi:uncharacterized protein (DUF4415 family)